MLVRHAQKRHNQLISGVSVPMLVRGMGHSAFSIQAHGYLVRGWRHAAQFGVTLHNLEEAAYLPGWFRSNLKLLFEPNQKIYWIVTSLVSVVIWVPIVGVCISPEDSQFQTVLSGFALLMVINVVVPHLTLTLVKRSYSPGTGTAILFNLPLGVLLIREQLNAVTTSHAQIWREAFLYALLLAVGALGYLYGAHAILAAREP